MFNENIIYLIAKFSSIEISVQWGKWIEQPTPEQVTKIIDTILENHSGDVNILFTSKDAFLQFGWDCLNMSI